MRSRAGSTTACRSTACSGCCCISRTISPVTCSRLAALWLVGFAEDVTRNVGRAVGRHPPGADVSLQHVHAPSSSASRCALLFALRACRSSARFERRSAMRDSRRRRRRGRRRPSASRWATPTRDIGFLMINCGRTRWRARRWPLMLLLSFGPLLVRRASPSLAALDEVLASARRRCARGRARSRSIFSPTCRTWAACGSAGAAVTCC